MLTSEGFNVPTTDAGKEGVDDKTRIVIYAELQRVVDVDTARNVHHCFVGVW
jgi:hypothetical protein